MGALSLRLPESLHRKLGEVAARDGVSINQWISTAVAEKMSAQLAQEYIAERARRASRQEFRTLNRRSSPIVFPISCGEYIAKRGGRTPGRTRRGSASVRRPSRLGK